jgi:tungstate transport system permease protein
MSSFSESLLLAGKLIGTLDATLVQIVLRSLYVSLVATLLALAIGLALGASLGLAKFKLKGLLTLLLNTYVAIPAVIVGLIVYVLLSRSGPLGSLGWLYSKEAMIFAQTLLVIPLVATMTRQVIADANDHLGDTLASMGTPFWQRAVWLLISERFALLTVAVTAFGRAISEVGTVMIVGGNIEGFTRVMTTAIALETSKGDLPMALALGAVLLLTVFLLNGVLALSGVSRETGALR